MLGFVRGMQVVTDRRICLPLDYAPEQLMGLLARYLDRNQGMSGLPANGVLEEALSDAYPCP